MIDRYEIFLCIMALWLYLPVGAVEDVADRWHICQDGSIQWIPSERLPHEDHWK